MASISLTKKAKVYGLGYHASTLTKFSSGSQQSIGISQQKSVPMVDTPKFKADVAKVTLKLEMMQKANEDEEKDIEWLKNENKGLKQMVDILFEKLNMVRLQSSEPKDYEDE